MKQTIINDIESESEVPPIILETFATELNKCGENIEEYNFTYFGEVGCDIPHYGEYDIGYTSKSEDVVIIMVFDWDKENEVNVVEFDIARGQHD
jgi:hypothetical protein